MPVAPQWQLRRGISSLRRLGAESHCRASVMVDENGSVLRRKLVKGGVCVIGPRGHVLFQLASVLKELSNPPRRYLGR